ncbi:glycosyltransferase family 4 protein [Candidatus Enterococcus clewellii]|uniref:Glycosyl transferase family 1 domain-containing protein n=1 Tax=Candidatus Enterococcus clewellii TaxID=1834193 RepID=A0AAQ3VZ15_9ENTE
MNILFLTLSNINSFEDQGLYVDLLNSLREKGNNIYVVSPIEKRNNEADRLITDEDSYILKLKVGNITKTNMIEKGISTLLIEKQYIKGVKKYFADVTFDLILYSTPPITLEKVIRYIKKRDKAKTYLLLKDIFPQNAVDLKILEPTGLKSIILRYFFRKEKRLYEISDYIGCMTKNNVNFILSNNEIDPQKVEICANSISPFEIRSEENKKSEIRKKYGIPENSVVFIYGGNLGKPQGIEYLLSNIAECNFKEAFFVIVGSGTEYNNLKIGIDELGLSNTLLISSLPKEEYNQLVSTVDVGMIFLNPDFTIPNFPSRFLTYLQASLPVIAATDDNCDLQYLLEENQLGFWSNTRDSEKFKINIEKLLDPKVRKENSSYSYSFLKENYDVRIASEIILNHFNME